MLVGSSKTEGSHGGYTKSDSSCAFCGLLNWVKCSHPASASFPRHVLPLESDGFTRHVEERVVKSVTSEMVSLGQERWNNTEAECKRLKGKEISWDALDSKV